MYCNINTYIYVCIYIYTHTRDFKGLTPNKCQKMILFLHIVYLDTYFRKGDLWIFAILGIIGEKPLLGVHLHI